jgi:hypothetical protein
MQEEMWNGIMPGVLIYTGVTFDFVRDENYAEPLFASLWRDGQAVLGVLTVYELTMVMKENEKAQTYRVVDSSPLPSFSGISPSRPAKFT